MTGWYIYAGCFVFSPALVPNNTELYIIQKKISKLFLLWLMKHLEFWWTDLLWSWWNIEFILLWVTSINCFLRLLGQCRNKRKKDTSIVSNLILNINVLFLFWPQIKLKQKQFQHYCIELYFNFGTLFVVHISINVVVVDWPKQDTATPLFQIFFGLLCYKKLFLTTSFEVELITCHAHIGNN